MYDAMKKNASVTKIFLQARRHIDGKIHVQIRDANG